MSVIIYFKIRQNLHGLNFSLNEPIMRSISRMPFHAVDDGDGCTCFSGASRTSAAVRVAFRIIRQAVIDDMGKVVNVQAACGHIGGYQQLQVAYAEHEIRRAKRRRCNLPDQFVGDFLCSPILISAGNNPRYVSERRIYLWHER